MLKVFESRRGLFTHEWGSKKREGAARRYIFSKKVDFLKEANGKIINTVIKQGELLKEFMDTEEFFDRVGLSWFNTYFRIGLYKILCKFPVLKNSTLRSSYFNSNFKLIKKSM